MKKNEITEKQATLKHWLKQIALSQRDFAAMYRDAEDENLNPDEVVAFQETFRKQINRPTTTPELLDKYLEFLYSLQKFKVAGYVRPECFSEKVLGEELETGMAELSNGLSVMLNDKKLDDY